MSYNLTAPEAHFYSSFFSTAVLVYFPLVQMLSRVGDKFENLKYATPLTLFNVDGLGAGDSEA